MSSDEQVERLLQRVALKPPTERLRQSVCQAAVRTAASAAHPGRVVLLRYGGVVAACLTLVLLVHWACEQQLTRWTRPLRASVSPQPDTATLEDLEYEMALRRPRRSSGTSSGGDRRSAVDSRRMLERLLNESAPPHFHPLRGDDPMGQSRNIPMGLCTRRA
jgi:hypothetical protein